MVHQCYPLDICRNTGPTYKTFFVLLLLLIELFKTLKTCRDNCYLAFNSSSVLNIHVITVSCIFPVKQYFQWLLWCQLTIYYPQQKSEISQILFNFSLSFGE